VTVSVRSADIRNHVRMILGVVGVQSLLDGANMSAEDISSPYSLSWNTRTNVPR